MVHLWVFVGPVRVPVDLVSPVSLVDPVEFGFGGLPYILRGTTYQKTRVILDMKVA